jgi:hypothetical protein
MLFIGLAGKIEDLLPIKAGVRHPDLGDACSNADEAMPVQVQKLLSRVRAHFLQGSLIFTHSLHYTSENSNRQMNNLMLEFTP